MRNNGLHGNFGISTETQLRMIERNQASIAPGSTIYYTTYRGYSEALGKVVERTTLDSTNYKSARQRYESLKANPHMSNVKFNTGKAPS